MSRRKYEFIEKYEDVNGVERIYGYTMDGLKYLVNLHEVVREYAARGLDGFRRA